MNGKRQPGIGPGIDQSKSIEDLHHLRLMALLDELVQDKGIMRAARELGVNYRTLAAARKSGRLSRRMRGALGQRLMEGGGSPAREQRQRNDELTGRLEKVEGQVDDMGQGLSAVQGEVNALGTDYAGELHRVESRLDRIEGSGGGVGEGEGESGSVGASPQRNTRLRRDFPDLATLEPAEDDEAVFADAWPLVQKWRGLRQSHPDRGRGLPWLREEERLMSVELALLEEHGLTLPPQTYPLRGLDRGAQTNWRRKALEDARRARQRRERVRWLLWALTLGRWRR